MHRARREREVDAQLARDIRDPQEDLLAVSQLKREILSD
jgi:hypothetical protein